MDDRIYWIHIDPLSFTSLLLIFIFTLLFPSHAGFFSSSFQPLSLFIYHSPMHFPHLKYQFRLHQFSLHPPPLQFLPLPPTFHFLLQFPSAISRSLNWTGISRQDQWWFGKCTRNPSNNVSELGEYIREGEQDKWGKIKHKEKSHKKKGQKKFHMGNFLPTITFLSVNVPLGN